MDNTDKPQENTSLTRSNSWDDYQDFIINIPDFIAEFSRDKLELTTEQQAFHNKHFNREEITNQIGFINGKLVHIRITLDATEHKVDDFALMKILPREHAKKLTNKKVLEENTNYAVDHILSDLRTIEGSKW
ncbi:conserved hypothetical protein [Vibrio crassostreae]|nr:conserved hypothetical protein [Vibrio crassostreae]CAK1829163.1 conserved hypothetical protein [Vibrio crassostreae]CAK1829470.1 conserved hypothetical protein [Vibrio crassostreae]CAK1830005.1 conserved hypothetical protein [Vibrio crassostreae]CAK2012586.1 conserved hypothetical protein [Vibrio crassostreae]